jgi:hypothetical protein
MEHSISVMDLINVLKLLLDDDELLPNQVGNLLIVRDKKNVGYINLLVDIPNDELIEFFDSVYNMSESPPEDLSGDVLEKWKEEKAERDYQAKLKNQLSRLRCFNPELF